MKNRTSSEHPRKGYYDIIDYGFSNGRSEILECSIEYGDQIRKFTKGISHDDYLEASTDEFKVQPGDSVKVSAKAVQYRRTNDSVWETFLTPTKNPEIEVIIDDCFDL